MAEYIQCLNRSDLNVGSMGEGRANAPTETSEIAENLQLL